MILQILQELGAKGWCSSLLCTGLPAHHCIGFSEPLSSGVWRKEMGKGSRREERKVKKGKKREKKKIREGRGKKKKGMKGK